MKLKISGTNFASHMAPLRAIDKTNESINCNLTKMAIVQEGEKKYFVARTIQPHYTAYIHQNLSGDPKSDDPLKAGIDREAVTCSADEHYEVSNSDFTTLLRNVGASKADFIVTEEGMSAEIESGTKFNILSVHNTQEGIIMPDISTLNFDSDDQRYHRGTLDGEALAQALVSPIAVARLGAKTCSLYARAVHLTLDDQGFCIEAYSGTASIISQSTRKTNAPSSGAGELLHLALSPQAAHVLRQVCDKTKSKLEWLYDEEYGILTVWCQPYALELKTELIDYQDMSQSTPQQSQITIDRFSLTNAVRLARNIGQKVLNFELGENGSVEVSTPNHAFTDTFTGEHTGTVCCVSLSLPLDALSACLAGCEDAKVVMHYDAVADYINLTYKDGVECEIEVV